MKKVSGYNPSKDPRLINCKTECGNERCFAKRYGLFAEKTCQNFKEPSIITNADRIRAMSDEEMAEFLWSIGNNPVTGNVYLNGKLIFFSGNGNGWLTYLKQEADHV